MCVCAKRICINVCCGPCTLDILILDISILKQSKHDTQFRYRNRITQRNHRRPEL